jgi:cytochrome c biogenesis protein CcmG/thiol:disulfide interchange protein DsbE
MKLIPFFIFFVLAIFLWRGLYLDPQKLPSVQQGKPLPAFSIPILGNEQQSHFNSADLKGKITLLNVWASWCESCAQEQAFLLKLAGEGMPIYGLNYKDDPEKALQWLQEWGNPYTTIGSDQLGKTAIDLGVYGTPETFLIDAQGLIVYRQVGVLDETSWNKEFLPRIRKLEKIG